MGLLAVSLLALATLLLGGDGFVAARVVSVVAAGIAVALAWRLVRRPGGEGLAGFVLLGLLVNPVLARHALEAGSDTPALALALGATVLVPEARGHAWRGFSGLLAGLAILTRSQALLLLPAVAAALARGPRRAQAMAAWAGGPWCRSASGRSSGWRPARSRSWTATTSTWPGSSTAAGCRGTASRPRWARASTP